MSCPQPIAQPIDSQGSDQETTIVVATWRAKSAVTVKLPKLIGRKPSLTAEQREICRLERMKRINGDPYVSTPVLARRFGVCEMTIKNAARDLHRKHQDFIARLVRLSAGLRAKGGGGTDNNSR